MLSSAAGAMLNIATLCYSVIFEAMSGPLLMLQPNILTSVYTDHTTLSHITHSFSTAAPQNFVFLGLRELKGSLSEIYVIIRV